MLTENYELNEEKIEIGEFSSDKQRRLSRSIELKKAPFGRLFCWRVIVSSSLQDEQNRVKYIAFFLGYRIRISHCLE